MFIGKSYFSIGDPSVKSHGCAPAHAKDYAVYIPRVAYYGIYLNSSCQDRRKRSWQVSVENENQTALVQSKCGVFFFYSVAHLCHHPHSPPPSPQC